MHWNLIPTGLDNLPQRVADHGSVIDLSEQTPVLLRADGDEVGTGLSVIEQRQPEAAALR
jgi:hypothetical protein